MRIPFDISKRPQIESGEYKVVNRIGEEVRIICWDWPDEDCPIIAFDGDRMPSTWGKDGRFMSWRESDSDLFIVTPEPELTEWQRFISACLQKHGLLDCGAADRIAKESAAELLTLARKQLQPEIDAMLEDAYKTADEVQYRKGREEALKDLPRWKKENSFETEGTFIGIKGKEWFVVKDGYSVPVTELLKLPGFKEDE